MWLKINADTVFLVPENASGTGISWKKYRHFLNIGIWGIETSFRSLKYTTGLLHLHSKKVACIKQEIYAKIIMYNFTEMITSHVIIKTGKRKYIYKTNFTIATHMCRMFFQNKASPPEVEAIIARETVPIRPGRVRPRFMKNTRTYICFAYKVA